MAIPAATRTAATGDHLVRVSSGLLVCSCSMVMVAPFEDAVALPQQPLENGRSTRFRPWEGSSTWTTLQAPQRLPIA